MLSTQNTNPGCLPRVFGLVPATPLYKRAPREDENGNPLSDFMMIIPKLKTRPEHLIRETINKIERVLQRHSNEVVFADLNLKLNVLCVVVRPEPGICGELPTEINNEVPEALLVAQPAL